MSKDENREASRARKRGDGGTVDECRRNGDVRPKRSGDGVGDGTTDEGAKSDDANGERAKGEGVVTGGKTPGQGASDGVSEPRRSCLGRLICRRGGAAWSLARRLTGKEQQSPKPIAVEQGADLWAICGLNLTPSGPRSLVLVSMFGGGLSNESKTLERFPLLQRQVAGGSSSNAMMAGAMHGTHFDCVHEST